MDAQNCHEEFRGDYVHFNRWIESASDFLAESVRNMSELNVTNQMFKKVRKCILH